MARVDISKKPVLNLTFYAQCPADTIYAKCSAYYVHYTVPAYIPHKYAAKIWTFAAMFSNKMKVVTLALHY